MCAVPLHYRGGTYGLAQTSYEYRLHRWCRKLLIPSNKGENAMRLSVGSVLYVVAIVITVLVIAAKYFGFQAPPITGWVMRDPTQSLLLALLLSFVARWI